VKQKKVFFAGLRIFRRHEKETDKRMRGICDKGKHAKSHKNAALERMDR
jgi:hypothetical protein